MSCAVCISISRGKPHWRVSLPSSEPQLHSVPLDKPFNLPSPISVCEKPFNLPTPISVCETLITTLPSHVVAKYAKHLIFQEGYELICGLGARLAGTCMIYRPSVLSEGDRLCLSLRMQLRRALETRLVRPEGVGGISWQREYESRRESGLFFP